MKNKLTVCLLACLLVLTMLVVAGCSKEPEPTEPSVETWKVTFYDSDGVTVLHEVEAEDGKPVAMPELTKEGYVIQGFFATPALLREFDPATPITADTAVFVAWQSSVEDNRPWMLAGSLRGYPENNWGKIWPQDDFRLTKVEGEFNTFEIVVNLYAGDSFKIAVIGEGYAWDDTASIDASHIADQSEGSVLSGGENAFDSGANIDVAEDGSIRDWTAFAKSGGLSALVYLKNPDNADDAARTYAVLKELMATETAGIGQIFTEEEARRDYHLGGKFSFVVEGDDYTSFSNDWVRPLVKPLDNRNYRFGRASHGHLPEKGPQPTLIAFGPDIKPGVVLENARLVDEAPTCAHALGLTMENVDGRALTELFK